MKIAMFKDGQGERLGVVEGDDIVDVLAGEPGLPRELLSWLQGGSGALAELRERAATGAPRLALASVELLPPIGRPSKFLGIGANYASHLREAEHLGLALPPHQIWFNKQTSCIVGPNAPIVMPAVSNQLDYEGELAVVIGRRCRHVRAADAPGVIAGYLVCNDVSVRDWQFRAPTATLGKSFDTHGPIGPWLVTADEIADPHRLRLRTWVNDELRQDGDTSEMRYDIHQQIEELSTVMTLEPGDILATGTPAGVGFIARPPRFLQVGDVVRIEIEGVGVLSNPVVAEARAAR